MRQKLVGLALALVAFSIWGSYPLLWAVLKEHGARPLEILAHRTVWAHVFGLVSLGLLKGGPGADPEMPRSGRVWWTCIISGALNMGNWLICIWAATTGHLIEASLGYFLAPLMAAALGVLVFREPLNTMQRLALGMAATSIVGSCILSQQFPTVALAAASTAAGYAAVRKRAKPLALTGMVIETLPFVPMAVGYLVWLFRQGEGIITRGAPQAGACLLAGAVTAGAILAYAGATTRLRLSTLGILQFIYPCAQFVIGLTVFHEELRISSVVMLCGILVALVLYSWATVQAFLTARAEKHLQRSRVRRYSPPAATARASSSSSSGSRV